MCKQEHRKRKTRYENRMPKPGCEANYIYKGLWGMKTTMKTNEKEPGLILAPCKIGREDVVTRNKNEQKRNKRKEKKNTNHRKDERTQDTRSCTPCSVRSPITARPPCFSLFDKSKQDWESNIKTRHPHVAQRSQGELPIGRPCHEVCRA